MAYDFFQENPLNVKFGDDPGHDDLFLFAETKDFTTIQDVMASPTAEGDTVRITGSHAFAVGKGFIKASTYREGVQVEGTSTGDPGFLGDDYMATGFLVGDYAALKEKVVEMKNKPFVVLVKDPKCSDVRYQQLGCKCSPAILKEYKYTSGGKLTGGKKGFLLTFATTCVPLDYEGTVVLKA